MNELALKNLVGQKILIHTAIRELEEQRIGGTAAAATLRGVEAGGIWVEHEGLTEDLSKAFSSRVIIQQHAATQIFLPYSSKLFAAALMPREATSSIPQ